jgi:hypothetical protein
MADMICHKVYELLMSILIYVIVLLGKYTAVANNITNHNLIWV